MGALVPLALTIAPEIARWLFGSDAEKTTAAVSQAVQTVTGTADVEAASAMLQSSPEAATQLRLELARIAATMEESARTTELERWTAAFRDTADARAQLTSLSSQKTALAWSAPLISATVLLTFGATMGFVMIHGMPAGSETAANLLLGTLAAMTTSVVSYWVGSSAGSARKDDRLAQSGK